MLYFWSAHVEGTSTVVMSWFIPTSRYITTSNMHVTGDIHVSSGLRSRMYVIMYYCFLHNLIGIPIGQLMDVSDTCTHEWSPLWGLSLHTLGTLVLVTRYPCLLLSSFKLVSPLLPYWLRLFSTYTNHAILSPWRDDHYPVVNRGKQNLINHLPSSNKRMTCFSFN